MKTHMLIVCSGLLFMFGTGSSSAQENPQVPEFSFRTDVDGNRYLNLNWTMLRNKEYLGLSSDQIQELDRLGRFQGAKNYADMTRLIYPEIENPSPFDFDLPVKVNALKLSDYERNFRIAQQSFVARNMAPFSARESTEAATEVLSPQQRPLARELMIDAIWKNFTWDQIIKGAEDVEHFELTANEKADFLRNATRIKNELRKDVMRLQKEAWDRMMKEIPTGEREKMERYLLIDNLDK